MNLVSDELHSDLAGDSLIVKTTYITETGKSCLKISPVNYLLITALKTKGREVRGIKRTANPSFKCLHKDPHSGNMSEFWKM